MLLLYNLEPVLSEEVQPGTRYILLSSAQEQIYLLEDCDIKYISIFGRPHNYGMFACSVDSVDKQPSSTTAFTRCPSIDGMFKHAPDCTENADLIIDWSI